MKPRGNRQKAVGKIQNSKLKIKYCLPVFGLFLALAGVGCGYQLSGAGEAFPKDVRTVFVEPFVNRSRDVGIDGEITAVLKSEFHRRGRLRVVDGLEQADAILSGVIRSFDHRVVAVNRKDEALQYEATLVVDMNLRRRTPDELLWRTRGARLTEVYSASRGSVVTTSSEFKSGTLNASDVRRFTDIQLTETLSLDARERLVERFARELQQRLLDMF